MASTESRASSTGLRSDDNDHPSERKILTLIVDKLRESNDEHALEFAPVKVQSAQEIIKRLDREWENRSIRVCYNSCEEILSVVVLPTRIHETHLQWLVESIWGSTALTADEKRTLRLQASPRISSFTGAYHGSLKEPDLCVIPRGMRDPTVVVESGWSESRPRLHTDAKLWLEGGTGFVQIVVVIKWIKRAHGRVSGDIEVFDRDQDGQIRLVQQADVFPDPGDSPVISLSKRQLFGPVLAAGQSGAAVVDFRVSELRKTGNDSIRDEGFIPA